MVKEINKDNYEEEVLKHEGVVVVKFYRAQGCANCQKMAPIFESFANSNPEVKCVAVNADENKDMPLPTGFRVLPGIFFYEKGEFIGHTEGVADEQQLKIPLMSAIELKAMVYDFNGVIAYAEQLKKQVEVVNGFIARKSISK